MQDKVYFETQSKVKNKFHFIFRHGREAHEGIPVEETAHEKENPTSPDSLYNYHSAKLTFGLILFEFNDAIKEGDGGASVQII